MGWISPSKLNQLGMLNMNRRNVDYISRYNQRESYPLVDNKLKTKRVMAEYGVPTPKLLQVVRHQHEIAGFRDMANEMNGFAVKPAKGSGGKGITVIIGRDNDEYIKGSGLRVNASYLERHLSNILAGLYSLAGTPDVAIIENLVESSPSLARYSHQGVPDIRIVVFQGYPVMAMLRLATRDSDGKANLHQGAVGVGLDIGTGRGLNAVQFNRPIILHPDTGLALDNIAIESWSDMLEIAARCYEATGLGYMGVDLVVDATEGPLLLELNARPGLAIQMANGRGLLPRLRTIERLKIPHFTPRERAAFAMEEFSAHKPKHP